MAVERKYERDIDLLLAEEFSVNPAFATWFLTKTKFSHSKAEVSDVFVSKADSLGESDLIVVFSVGSGGKVALFIEDKVDAPLQFEQAKRYRQRANREVASGSFDDYEVVLCSPTSYPLPSSTNLCQAELETFTEADEFDRFISYEEIASWLAEIDGSPRALYRAAFISTAAVRRSNQWARVQDTATDVFWDALYQVASTEFPILEMKYPKLTKNANWITLRPRDMPTSPKKIYIEFKAGLGRIDLTFTKTSAHQFAAEIGTILPAGMTVHQTGASAAIRISSPVFRVDDGVDIGVERARLAFRAAARLVEFYRANRTQLEAAASKATRTEVAA